MFALLLMFAINLPAALDDVANPADAAYVPRPEWYFLGLFQLLKYFPGPLEPVGTMVIPGLIVGFLLALPFLDWHPERHPFHRSRLLWTTVMMLIGVATVALTTLGLKDTPERGDVNDWGPRSIAGHAIVTQPNNACAKCHVTGGPAPDLAITRLSKPDEWLLAHMADPVAIAPGVRSDTDPAPPPQMTRFQAQSVVAYLRRIRAGASPPTLGAEQKLAATTFAGTCVGCHKIAGEGGTSGPDLSKVGAHRDAASIRKIITDPTVEYPDTMMPTFGERLSASQIDALAQYLANRR